MIDFCVPLSRLAQGHCYAQHSCGCEHACSHALMQLCKLVLLFETLTIRKGCQESLMSLRLIHLPATCWKTAQRCDLLTDGILPEG